MSFEIQENVTLTMPNVSDKVKKLAEADSGKRNKILTEIAAIHVGLTGNFNMYTEEALQQSVKSWIDPYAKPILLNHDDLSDPMGRVMAARMQKETDGTPYIQLQTAITSPAAIERVLDERYITGSVGGKSEIAMCSICGTDWAQAEGMSAPCRHKRGKVYEGKLAYFELGGISWREYSFVNIPGDKKSQLQKVSDNGSTGEESDDGWIRAVRVFSMDMNKESILDLEEDVDEPQNILESMKRIEAAFTYQNIKGTFLTTTALDLGNLLEKENSEKITFIPNDTTIESETVENDHVVASEENKTMPKNDEAEVQEDDILAVAESLRADRDSEDSEVSAQEEQNSEDEVVDESAESSDQETETAEESQEAPAEEEATEEVATEDAVAAPEDEEASKTDEVETEQALVGSDDSDAVSDSPQESVSEKSEDEASQDASILEELQNRVDALVAENAKLKQHLHYMLAERVVDAKISVGLVDFDNRSVALTEHESRTASSLRDALKDIEVLAVSQPDRVKPGNLMNVKAQAVEGENAAKFEENTEDQTPVMTENERFAFVMSEALMGRKSL